MIHKVIPNYDSNYKKHKGLSKEKIQKGIINVNDTFEFTLDDNRKVMIKAVKFFKVRYQKSANVYGIFNVFLDNENQPRTYIRLYRKILFNMVKPEFDFQVLKKIVLNNIGEK